MPSTSEALAARMLANPRDTSVANFSRSLVVAARDAFGNRFIAEGPGDPRQLYTETHYALAAVLLNACDPRDGDMLDLAEARLRLWATGTYPLTFFNAMAIILALLVLRRSGSRHRGLEEILDRLIAETREHRHVAYPQWCGNNAYLQQVAIDTVLLPAARSQSITREGLDLLVGQFRSFRTPEGFFYDLPRSGTSQEHIAPPTYIMKMLFLLGICHEVRPSAELAGLFRAGMNAVLPLLSREGHFSYFGRTDNSPFAAGLGIFNLRKGATMAAADRGLFEAASVEAEQFFLSFPRVPNGLLQCNRFSDPGSEEEATFSRDDYAYVGQYSLAGCAYALLACYWFPANAPDVGRRAANEQPAVAVSNDLGIVKLRDSDRELIVRTRSEITSWDRRYLGPTILRYSVGDRLVVGAVSRTIESDEKAQSNRASGRARRLIDHFRYRFVRGAEQLDATSVGFVPVLRRGSVDYVPYRPLSVEASPSSVTMCHEMLRAHTRGIYPCLVEALEIAHFTLPGLKPRPYTTPLTKPTSSKQFRRTISLERGFCRLDDELTGNLAGDELIFSVRRMPGATIRVHGLTKVSSLTGWGSNGRQTLDVYAGQPAKDGIRYQCEILES